MIKWIKERSRYEKWLLAFIVVLLIGIAMRWGFIKKEAGDAIRHRIEQIRSPEKPERRPEADSVGRDIVRDTIDL